MSCTGRLGPAGRQDRAALAQALDPVGEAVDAVEGPTIMPGPRVEHAAGEELLERALAAALSAP